MNGYRIRRYSPRLAESCCASVSGGDDRRQALVVQEFGQGNGDVVEAAFAQLDEVGCVACGGAVDGGVGMAPRGRKVRWEAWRL